jgi:Nif-specific regulatory protein
MTDSQQRADGTVRASRELYLVVRQRQSWRDIYRLIPGLLVTIGRDPGSRIVLDDELCSRRHCDVYDDDSVWMIRDSHSRNGTVVNGQRITQPGPLREGDVICVGTTELLFTGDICGPLDGPHRHGALPKETGVATEEDKTEPLIVDRKSETRFVTESTLFMGAGRGSGVRQAFTALYGLIVRMLSSADRKGLCQTVLDGLLPAIGADIGAVLLFPETVEDRADPSQLQIVSYRAPKESPYHRVSTKLSRLALEGREAVLAMGIPSEPQQSEFRTLSEMQAQSVICAPIRGSGHVHGLVHLYSLQSNRQLDADSLEFVLAVADHLATIVNNLDQKESLTAGLQQARDQNRSLRQLLEIESDLIGDSLPIRELRDAIARIAASDATALIRGESGVGKELVARAIHFNSNRRQGPFVCVNCAALTETLLESELFGHEKGAFTGATDKKIGKFEQAHQGTLFLDEVGEMPLSIQARFLRVLEGHPFERVGGTASVDVDVRLVAATNRDLEAAVEEGEFRRDLLYRLQVIEIRVPRLRDHAPDVPALAEHLLERACRRLGRPQMPISSPALEALTLYDWPGNVRELRNVIERAVVLAEGPVIKKTDLRFTPIPGVKSDSPDVPSGEFEPVCLEEVERLHISRALDWTNWRKREAARILGINRSTLDRKIEKYEIPAPKLAKNAGDTDQSGSQSADNGRAQRSPSGEA